MVNYIKTFDMELFLLFNRRLNCNFLSIFMQSLTQMGSGLFSITVPLILIIYGRERTAAVGVKMVLTLVISEMLVYIIKKTVNRPRPYKTMDAVVTGRLPSCQYSFPSGHSCAAFTIALVLSSVLPGYKIYFLSVAVLVGISRVYLGVHYPSDILVGFLIAYGSFVL